MTGFLNKRNAAVMLALIIALMVLPIHAEATQIVSTQTEYLPDGGYIETVITESVSRASGTKTGTKATRYVDSD